MQWLARLCVSRPVFTWVLMLLTIVLGGVSYFELGLDKYPNIEDQIAVVTNGKGEMPSWRGDLTPKEIRKVVEYTRTGLGQ